MVPSSPTPATAKMYVRGQEEHLPDQAPLDAPVDSEEEASVAVNCRSAQACKKHGQNGDAVPHNVMREERHTVEK